MTIMLERNDDIPPPFVTTITGPLLDLSEAQSLVRCSIVALLDGANHEVVDHINKLSETVQVLQRKLKEIERGV